MQKSLFLVILLLLIIASGCASKPISQRVQIEVVAAGTTGTLVVYRIWHDVREELLRTDAYVGKNGCDIDKREGDGKTPVGVFEIRRGFGLATPPKVGIAYTQLQGGEQWVDDVASARYNQWATKDTTPVDWKSAEDLPKETVAYKYAAVIEYNTANIVKGAGSAIFLHCSLDRPTAGCVSVSEEAMTKILGIVTPGTQIVIARSDEELKQLTK